MAKRRRKMAPPAQDAAAANEDCTQGAEGMDHKIVPEPQQPKKLSEMGPGDSFFVAVDDDLIGVLFDPHLAKRRGRRK